MSQIHHDDLKIKNLHSWDTLDVPGFTTCVVHASAAVDVVVEAAVTVEDVAAEVDETLEETKMMSDKLMLHKMKTSAKSQNQIAKPISPENLHRPHK